MGMYPHPQQGKPKYHHDWMYDDSTSTQESGQLQYMYSLVGVVCGHGLTVWEIARVYQAGYLAHLLSDDVWLSTNAIVPAAVLDSTSQMRTEQPLPGHALCSFYPSQNHVRPALPLQLDKTPIMAGSLAFASLWTLPCHIVKQSWRTAAFINAALATFMVFLVNPCKETLFPLKHKKLCVYVPKYWPTKQHAVVVLLLKVSGSCEDRLRGTKNPRPQKIKAWNEVELAKIFGTFSLPIVCKCWEQNMR